MKQQTFSIGLITCCPLLLAIASLAQSAPVNSAVLVTTTPNPVVQGQTVTITAGVNEVGQAPPTGVITISDTCVNGSSSVLGTLALGGNQTLAISSFPCLGANTIVGAYSGDANYLPNLSQPLVETVLSQFTPVNLTLNSGPNPATVAQSVSLTATFSYTTINGTSPTGTVQFTDTNTGLVLGRAPVITAGGGKSSATTATLTVNLAAGVYTVQAAYSGSNIYAPSTSQILSQVVQGTSPLPTSTVLTASATQITVGQPVAFTAQVNAPNGIPTGAVNFYDGTTLLATLNLNPTGQTVLNISSLAVGNHSITTSYGGDADFGTSVSGTVTVTVEPGPPPTLIPTTTALNSSKNPALDGDTITLMAAVTSSATNTPTGTVTFSNGGAVLGASNVEKGVAILNISFPAGTYQLSATYSGDSSFASSAGTLSQMVNPRALIPTTTILSSSTNLSTVGLPVTFTAVVSAADSSIPTGSVTFTVSSLTANVTLDDTGTAVFTTSLPIGSASASAAFAGDVNHVGSISPTLKVLVLGTNSWGPMPQTKTSMINPFRSAFVPVFDER